MNSAISESSLKEAQDNQRAENIIQITTIEKSSFNVANPKMEHKITIIPCRLSLPKSNTNNNTENFRENVNENSQVSHHAHPFTIQSLQNRVQIISIWMKNPLNMAIFLWICCVAISGAILFLAMTGMLNHVLLKTKRDTWFEVNNQILNALFTLMCLYQHPRRFHHLVCLIRWTPHDMSTLRKAYSKNATYKPRERAHIAVVVGLLHVNCFAQYALCSLNLGYESPERPVVGVGVCLSIAIAAPAIACAYCIISSLGKEHEFGLDEESIGWSNHSRVLLSRNEAKNVEAVAEWRSGGLFDLFSDVSVSFRSLFCCFCVLGWNVERLGLGNKYVHTATFFLFCTAPYCIFILAATKIDNDTIREAFGITGAVLCVFGLLYGGFWRIKMRQRFELPTNVSCCGKPEVVDCAQWLFCCWCSLAQEMRTLNFYNTFEDEIFRQMPGTQFAAFGTSVKLKNCPELSVLAELGSECPEEKVSNVEKGGIANVLMKPPIPLVLQREDQSGKNI